MRCIIRHESSEAKQILENYLRMPAISDCDTLSKTFMQPRRRTSLFPEMSEASSASAASGTPAPLPDRMRPLTLQEFVGQEHLVGEGRVLRRLIEGGGALPSLILWGPPGTGKTTLAQLLADKTNARFVALS